jgi:replicative DNA helicase
MEKAVGAYDANGPRNSPASDNSLVHDAGSGLAGLLPREGKFMSNTTSRTGWGQADYVWLWARPPQEPDAEQAVLGACLHSRTALTAVADALTASDFGRPAHQVLWPVMLALHQDGTPVDPITLGHRLQRDGLLRRAGGRDYLAQLAGAAYSVAAVDHYAAIVAEAAWSRRLQQLGKDLIAATAHSADPSALTDQALDRLTEAANHHGRTQWCLAAVTPSATTNAGPSGGGPAGQSRAVRISAA